MNTDSPSENRLPDVYVDAYVGDCSVEQSAAGTITINLKLVLDPGQRFNAKPGSSYIMLNEIMEMAQSPGGRLRLSGTTVAKSELEAALIQPDGSMRDLLEGEGTW